MLRCGCTPNERSRKALAKNARESVSTDLHNPVQRRGFEKNSVSQWSAKNSCRRSCGPKRREHKSKNFPCNVPRQGFPGAVRHRSCRMTAEHVQPTNSSLLTFYLLLLTHYFSLITPHLLLLTILTCQLLISKARFVPVFSISLPLFIKRQRGSKNFPRSALGRRAVSPPQAPLILARSCVRWKRSVVISLPMRGRGQFAQFGCGGGDIVVCFK